MLKNILKLDGVKELSKNAQKNVQGGRCGDCDPEVSCCNYCTKTGCFIHSCTNCPDPNHCGGCV